MIKDKALFIIDSPFQALCSIEAINYYGIKEVHYLLFKESSVKDKILSIIEGKGINHFIEIKRNITTSIAKNLILGVDKGRFSTIFIGDYFSYGQYAAAVITAKKDAQIIYLDDGNSTIGIAPPVSRKRGRSEREKKYLQFWDFIATLKKINRRLFTIYDLNEGGPLPIEKNKFRSLSALSAEKKNIYIIGTNSAILKFNNRTYNDLLNQLAIYLNSHYPNECVYYCPHGRDTNEYNDLISSFGWKIYETKINVEIDFIQSKVAPLCVIGFGSTALLTLKNIYQSSDVKTIYMDLEEELINKEYRSIESYYVNKGIELIYV